MHVKKLLSGQNGTWLPQYTPPPQFENPGEINADPSRMRHVPVTTGGKTLRSTLAGHRETPTWYKEHTKTCNITPDPVIMSNSPIGLSSETQVLVECFTPLFNNF